MTADFTDYTDKKREEIRGSKSSQLESSLDDCSTENPGSFFVISVSFVVDAVCEFIGGLKRVLGTGRRSEQRWGGCGWG